MERGSEIVGGGSLFLRSLGWSSELSERILGLRKFVFELEFYDNEWLLEPIHRFLHLEAIEPRSGPLTPFDII